MGTITNKKKLIYLGIGFAIALLLVYSLAISETISVYSKCQKNQDSLVRIEKAPQNIAQINAELNKIEQVIGQNSDSSALNTQEDLLELVTDYCSQTGVILKEFPQPQEKDEKDYIVETNRVDLQGGFIKLVKFIYMLEKNHKIGKVVSTNFNALKDIKTKQYNLIVSIYIQNVRKTKN